MLPHAASKQSEASTVSGPSSPAVTQVDGACMGKPSPADAGDASAPARPAQAAAVAKAEEPAAQAKTQDMPHFLRITDKEMQEKYAELTRLEEERLAASANAPPDGEWARLDPDPTLDRYNNIHPWSNNRIKLQVPEGFNDYINASPVTLVSTADKQSTLKAGIQDKYICMQGPKKETTDHVWHMVWHEVATPYNSSPAIIIMLAPTHGTMPDGTIFEKCFPYYPLDENSPPLVINETNDLGEDFKAVVRFISREPGIPGTKIEIRKMEMTVDGEDEEKPIWHYLYPNWPDFGALEEENVNSILALMGVSRRKNGRGENPRVVHCSAGVGRTGTFVALEFLIGELEGGAWEGWDSSTQVNVDPIYETVNQLRMQRKTMVQAFEQYAFIYEVLRKVWEEKYHIPCGGGEHKHEAAPEIVKPRKNICGWDEDDDVI